MFKNKKVLLALGCVLFLLAATFFISGGGDNGQDQGPQPRTIIWATAPLGGAAFVVVSAIASVVERHEPGLRITVQATQGSDENPRLMRDRRIDICHTTSANDAFTASGAFTGEPPVSSLQTLFSMYSNEQFICVLYDSHIRTMEDLVGARIVTGPPGSGGHQMAMGILEAYDLADRVRIINLGYPEGADALKDGTVDALSLFTSGSIAPAALAQLDQSANIRLIPMDQSILRRSFERYPDLGPTVNRRGSLRALPDEDFHGLGTFSIQYADERMSEETAYLLLKTIFENLEELITYHRLTENITLDTALEGASKQIPVHPGAARFFKEKGVWIDGFTVGTTAPNAR